MLWILPPLTLPIYKDVTFVAKLSFRYALKEPAAWLATHQLKFIVSHKERRHFTKK